MRIDKLAQLLQSAEIVIYDQSFDSLLIFSDHFTRFTIANEHKSYCLIGLSTETISAILKWRCIIYIIYITVWTSSKNHWWRISYDLNLMRYLLININLLKDCAIPEFQFKIKKKHVRVSHCFWRRVTNTTNIAFFCLHNDNLGRCDIFIQSETVFIDDEYSQGLSSTIFISLMTWKKFPSVRDLRVVHDVKHIHTHGKISALSTNTWVLRVWKHEQLDEYRRHCMAIKNYLRKYGWNYQKIVLLLWLTITMPMDIKRTQHVVFLPKAEIMVESITD